MTDPLTSNLEAMRSRMIADEELSEAEFERLAYRIAIEAHEDRLQLWEALHSDPLTGARLSPETTPVNPLEVPPGVDPVPITTTVAVNKFLGYPLPTFQANTPTCPKCGQIDLRIPRMGIYHVCPTVNGGESHE